MGRLDAGTSRQRIVAVTVLVVLLMVAALMSAEAQVSTASITVILDTVPDDDQDFEFTTSGAPLPASFVLDDDEGFAGSPDPGTLQNAWTSDLVPAGVTYSIAQTPVAGWALLSATCDNGDMPSAITPDPDTNVTCTFVVEAAPAAITVTKTVETIDGFSWSFDIAIDPVDPGVTAPQSVSGTGSGSGMVTFEPLTLNRTYTIIEPPLPGEWEQVSFICSVADENPAMAGYQATITEPGENITCEIVNRTVATITVVLDAVPDSVQDFEFTTSGAPLPVSFVLDDDENLVGSPDPTTLQNAWTSPLVPAGATYSIAQAPVAGWMLVSATCDNGDSPDSITPAPGVNVTCTFVNEFQPGGIVQPVPGPRWPWLAVLVALMLFGTFVHRHAK